jgi:hypothetical protein
MFCGRLLRSVGGVVHGRSCFGDGRWPTASLDGPTDRYPAATHDAPARRPRGWLRSGAGVAFDRGAPSGHERGADMAGRQR